MISAATVCHLPTMVLANMKKHHHWYHDLYNRWLSDVNIIADNPIYPEFIGGEVWWGRICDQLGDWYVKPETRFDLIRKWEYFIKDSMSYQELDRTEVRTRDLILSDGQTYDEF